MPAGGEINLRLSRSGRHTRILTRIGGASFNPRFEIGDHMCRQFSLRRHLEVFIPQGLHEQASVSIARDDRRPRLATFAGRFATVEQFCAGLHQAIGPVATGPTLQIGPPTNTALRAEPIVMLNGTTSSLPYWLRRFFA